MNLNEELLQYKEGKSLVEGYTRIEEMILYLRCLPHGKIIDEIVGLLKVVQRYIGEYKEAEK